MLDAEQIQKLKQSNISQDADLTRERVKEALAQTTAGQKKEILALVGQNASALYRVAREGKISAKFAVALAQMMNVAPAYYTGADEEKSECTDAAIQAFLQQHGYQKPRKSRKAAAPKATKEAVPTAPEQMSGEILVTVNCSPQMQERVETLDVESATILLQALYLRAGGGGGEAKQLWEVVKYCLLA